MNEDRATRGSIWIAAAFGSASAAFAYAALRAIAYFTSHEANPALVIWTEHAGYFWRVITSSFFGAFVMLAALVAARSQIARFLPWIMMIATIAIALQSALIP